jgi:spore coat polysaccharide biosynthesis protein SpsF
MRINISIEARMNSKRLPGKVNLPLGDTTILGHLIANLKKSTHASKIILATTVNKIDDVLVEVADAEKIQHFRGDENNVLKRVTDAHKLADTDVAVLITADNPFISADLVDEAIEVFLNSDCDFLTNSGKNRKYPDGLDVIVTQRRLLEYSLEKAETIEDKEHVCNIILNDKTLKKINYIPDANNWYPNASVTVDTFDDYAKAQKIASQLERGYSYQEFLNVIKVYGEHDARK